MEMENLYFRMEVFMKDNGEKINLGV